MKKQQHDFSQQGSKGALNLCRISLGGDYYQIVLVRILGDGTLYNDDAM